MVHRKPEKEGICDVCGGKLIQRTDDMEDTVRRRLNIYLDQTAPVVDYYRGRNVLEIIDGSRTIEDAKIAIKKALGEDA